MCTIRASCAHSVHRVAWPKIQIRVLIFEIFLRNFLIENFCWKKIYFFQGFLSARKTEHRPMWGLFEEEKVGYTLNKNAYIFYGIIWVSGQNSILIYWFLDRRVGSVWPFTKNYTNARLLYHCQVIILFHI